LRAQELTLCKTPPEIVGESQLILDFRRRRVLFD